MTPYEALLPVGALRQLVRLDADTGNLYWLQRGVAFFEDCEQKTAQQLCDGWNRRHVGKRAVNNKHGRGYLHGTILGIKFLAHRVVWALATGAWPQTTIDHIDGRKKNNRPSNLRDVSHKTNMRNQRQRVNNTSGQTGVSFDRARGKFSAQVMVDGRAIHLGRFQSIEAASSARDASYEAHGFHPGHGKASP